MTTEMAPENRSFLHYGGQAMAVCDSGRSLLAAGDDPSGYPPVQCAPFTPASWSVSAVVHFLLGADWETREVEEAFFRIGLREYFSVRGQQQRLQRQQLLSLMTQSEAQEAEIREVLGMVAEMGSQEVIEAAVDLLTGLGQKTVQLAMDLAFQRKIQSDDVAFVVALAAGRANRNVVNALSYSKHNAIREAAVELAADMPAAQAKPILRHIARDDESSYLRNRAVDLLEEFE